MEESTVQPTRWRQRLHLLERELSSATSCAMKKSTNGGSNFSADESGLHADTHGLFIDPLTNPVTVYTVDDGGVFKRPDSAAGSTWTNLNNGALDTLQFVGIASHPSDRNMVLGGNQDNGTAVQTSSAGNWSQAENGDGGYSLIDQNATDTTNVTMYHTLFNITGQQIGFDRIINTS